MSAADNTSGKIGALESSRTISSLISVMRPHQWVKNLFVLAPLLFSGKLGNWDSLERALLACATFCLMSSALYIVNDIIDASADRLHPEKRHRPLASGALSIRAGLLASILLFASAASIASSLGHTFAIFAGIYFSSTLSYCVVFKRTMIIDCILIAAGFVLRVVGGAVAIQVVASHWLIVCAFLLALYLAFSKRRQELLTLTDGAIQHRRVLGQYTVGYLEQVNTVLLAAVIVCYALYTVSPQTIGHFGTDSLIYGTVFVLYGLLRYMALARDTSASAGDAGKLLLRDGPLQLTVAAWAAYNAAVIYWPR
jgi:4-hydroxybenzoate polyprenyltransferase